MVMNRRIIIDITPLQNQLIQNKAEMMGYKNKSSFARDMIFKDDYDVEKMICEIYGVVCKND